MNDSNFPENERQKAPLVTVLMAVHNGESFLHLAVDSILEQTFTDFEFLIVEDGSTDATSSILADFAAKDDRIRVLPNLDNLGLTPSLNIGLRSARGQYIARMDADDICMPERLRRQVDYLNVHLDVQLLGTGFVTIDSDGLIMKQDIEACEPWECVWLSMVRTPLTHPTVMFRTSLVTTHGLYFDENLQTAQDFDLWVRMMDIGNACALPDALVSYRMHANNVSTKRKESQKRNMKEIAMTHLLRRLPELSPQKHDFECFFNLFCGIEKANARNSRRAVSAMHSLIRAFLARFRLTSSQRRIVWQTACRWLIIAIFREGGGVTRPLVLACFLFSASQFLLYAPLEIFSYFRRRNCFL